jgi:hypothetical protein
VTKHTDSDALGQELDKKKSGGKRASGKDRDSRDHEPRGEGGPEEAAAFIAETAADLEQLARRHGLDMLTHLLRMAKLEAEEYLGGKRNLS